MLVQKVKPGLKGIETYTVDQDGNRKHLSDCQYGSIQVHQNGTRECRQTE